MAEFEKPASWDSASDNGELTKGFHSLPEEDRYHIYFTASPDDQARLRDEYSRAVDESLEEARINFWLD